MKSTLKRDERRTCCPNSGGSRRACHASFFERTGFEVDSYDDGYGFVRRHAIEIHYTLVSDLDPFKKTGAVYIAGADVDRSHQQFVDRGLWLVPRHTPHGMGMEPRRRWAAGESIARITEVEDKPWEFRELELLDPNNNLLRFGQRVS